MKKFIKILSALAMAVCLLVCATGCVSNNWGRAKEKLEAEGYTVTATVNTDDLASVAKIKAGLVACGVATADTDPIDAFVSATKDGKIVYIFYCESGEIAKELYDAIDAKKASLLDTYNMEEGDAKLGKMGSVVYFGHKEAVKAA